MRSAAALAALACVASAAFSGEGASIFNTWNPSEEVRLVDDFMHIAQIFHPQVHEEEHRRRKRNAVETARFGAGNPITNQCDRPGYTGRYCEFPICDTFNPVSNPEQFLRDEGYIIDLTDLGSCNRHQKILVDYTMYDIRIQVQSLENVSPKLSIADENGYFGTPDKIVQEQDRFVAHFTSLPAGAYTVIPSASSLDSHCILTTTAQTILTISGGFQTDDRDRTDFPNDNAGAHQFNSIMLTLHGGASPSTLKTVSVVGPDNYVLRPRELDRRYGCQYEFYFDSLFCYTKGSYALVAEGVDFYGNLFRRVAPFECVNQPGATTPAAIPSTPQPTNPTSCANGGVLLESGGKTTCACQDHWTGFDCSQALCINGGTLLQGKCFCPIGFEGIHCEQVKCEPNANFVSTTDQPTLVIVVRARFYQNDILTQVQKAIDESVANLQFDPTYLTRFHLVVFNYHKIILSKYYTSIEKFDFDFELQTQSTDRVGKCATDTVLGAVAAALTDATLTPGSMIYVITDALADDYSSEIEAIMQLNSFARAVINFVYVQPDAGEKCIATDPSDPGFRALDEVANRFGGMAWHVNDRKKVYSVLFGHMNSIIYKSQLMLDLDREECNNGLAKVMQIDKSSETMVFVSRGNGFNLDITAPDGTRVIPRLVTTEGIFTVRQWSSPLAGTYMIRATTEAPTAACSLRAYQASKKSLSSNAKTEAYWAMTTDVDTDVMMNQPIAGMDNHPVFHIENFGDDYDHAFAFLNMYAVRGGVEQEVYASNGLFRGACSFQFYFPKFRCRPNENLHYEFNLRDEEGFYVQRAGVMTCFNYVPTPSSPVDCQNAGVKFNGTCLCQPHFEGEHCQSVICENGGTVVFGACQCPAGWAGQFCTFPQCPESGPLPSFGYNVDMAFLVEVTQRGVEQIDQLLSSLPDIIRDVQSQHSEWIDRLVLIGYDSTGVVGMVDTPVWDTQMFFHTLYQWSDMNPKDNECTIQIWQALNTLLYERRDGKKRRELPDRSIINIMTATAPNNFDDASASLIAPISEDLLEKRAIMNVFRAKNWNKDCKGYESDFDNLAKVVRRGEGMMYTLGTGDLGLAVRMIPTLFSSSIVYKYHEPWCDHQALVYFPLDAYTQTVTAVVRGASAVLDLRRYDGSSLSADSRIDIVHLSDNIVVEFRNPCDGDWEPVSQYCMYISRSVEKSYSEANDLCASMGGFMADDLNQEKNNWLDSALGQKQGWLGLAYVDGEWVFQQDNGQSIPPPKNFNKWITGEAPKDDSKGACAYIFNGLWYPMTCDREYVVICQKHMYNRDNLPSNLGDNDLSPGMYQLIVQTDINADDHSCDVEIRVQSALNVEFGFVDDLRRDMPHPIANVDSNENRVVASMSNGKAKTQSVDLQHVLLRTDDASSTLLEAATLSSRFGCTYDFVSQPLNCDLTNGEDFSVVIIGEDDAGNSFQRYSTSHCEKWYTCQNGGVYSNGQCLCADYYTGDQCERPICQNGGELSFAGDSCICPSRFAGDACQFVQCDINSNATFTDDGKAFVLVLEKSANTADAIQKIALSIHQLYENMWDRHENWIDKYMVQTFTLDGQFDELSVFVNTDQFTQYLMNIANQARLLPGTCEMPIWSALDHLFTSSLAPYLSGSELLIVSAAAPNLDADVAAIQETMEKFDIQTPYVDFLHIENVNCWITDWEKDVGDFANFIATTGGIMFRAEPARAGEAVEVFVPTRYAAQRLSYSDPYNCKNNEIYIQVDSGMSLVYVMVGAPGATMEVTTPLKDYVGNVDLWDSDEQMLWGIYPKYPGIYKIRINADSAACFPVVYGSGGSVVTGQSHASQVFTGFIQDYNFIDTPKPYAVYGAVNFPVFFIYELEGHQLPTETLYTARMTRTTIDGKTEESYMSDVDQRDGCSYNYVGKAFTCVELNDVITLSISGVDGKNQPFTRQSTTYCKAAPSTTKACVNGGVFSGGQCICPEYYGGDLCERPFCQNDGVVAASGNKCTCKQGYAGNACQYVQCDAKSDTQFTDDHKALIFVMEKSANTADAIHNIAMSIHNLAEAMWNRHENWVDKYLVQIFTTEGTEYGLSYFHTTDQLTQYLIGVSNEARAMPGACKMPIWKALDSLFDSQYTEYLPGSEVVIVSAASPDDLDMAAIHHTMEKFGVQSPIVDFLHIENDQCPIESWKNDVADFSNFLSTTGGIVFRSINAMAGEAVEEFVPTRYAPQKLSYSDPFNCKDNDLYIQVDTGMAWLYVMVGEPGATMKVETPLKDQVGSLQIWNSLEQSLWSIYPKYPGIYKITINSDSPACFPVVYGSGASVATGGQHASQVFSGFIQSSNSDKPTPYAMFGEVNYPVFFIYELEGHQLPTETLYTARMTIRTIDGYEEESYTSDVDLRDGCSYNYVGKGFICIAQNEVLTLSISGVDGNNQPFTRQSTTYCRWVNI